MSETERLLVECIRWRKLCKMWRRLSLLLLTLVLACAVVIVLQYLKLAQ